MLHLTKQDKMNQNFNQFIHFIFRHSDTITLLDKTSYGCLDTHFQKELHSYKQFEKTVDYWFGWPEPSRRADTNEVLELRIIGYPANESIKNLLPKYFNSIFLSETDYALNKKSIYTDLVKKELSERDPELYNYLLSTNFPFHAACTLDDIGFFKGNNMILGTVSHENMCYAYPPDQFFEDRLYEFGVWKEVNDKLNTKFVLPRPI